MKKCLRLAQNLIKISASIPESLSTSLGVTYRLAIHFSIVKLNFEKHFTNELFPDFQSKTAKGIKPANNQGKRNQSFKNVVKQTSKAKDSNLAAQVCGILSEGIKQNNNDESVSFILFQELYFLVHS